MSPSAPLFETPRLLVRPFAPADLEAFVAYRAHPEVERYQSWSDYTLEQGRSLIESMQDSRPAFPASGTSSRWWSARAGRSSAISPSR